MNRNPVRCEDLATNRHPEPQSGPTSDSRAWHRPTTTIIDVKRTMFGPGGYFDGLDASLVSPAHELAPQHEVPEQ